MLLSMYSNIYVVTNLYAYLLLLNNLSISCNNGRTVTPLPEKQICTDRSVHTCGTVIRPFFACLVLIRPVEIIAGHIALLNKLVYVS